MKILVVGASLRNRRTLRQVSTRARASVSAFSRNPAKLDIIHAALTKIVGDFHDAASVRGAVASQDAVIISAAPKPSAIKDTPDYFSRSTKYCIDAMKEHGVKRLVVLSAFGVGDSEKVAGWFMKTVFIDRLLKGFYRDHDVQECMTRESGLDFVIARPTRLTNGRAKEKYVRSAELISTPPSISRADLADFMVEACEPTIWVGKAVQLGG